MKIDILTLFPKMFDGFKNESIIKRAIESNKVEINTCDFRNFSEDKHKKVDDTPYGGGAGMVLMCQPIFDAVKKIKKENSKVILLSPQGKKYTQEDAYRLSKDEHLIFICGHYEGFDERIKSICDEEISIGDYVLTGGELASMVICDSIIRLLPGVIDEMSHINDSFNDNLLDYPTYTKPRNYNGLEVPNVLLSGDHKKIDEWRFKQRIKATKEKRPDLLKNRLVLDKNGIRKVRRKISVDDIKNIRVRKFVVNNNFILKKSVIIINNNTLKPKKISGYKLKGKDKNGNIIKILISRPNLARHIASKNVLKKIDVLNYRFNIALESNNDELSKEVLGQSELLRQMVISNYSVYLGKEKLDNIIKNINNLTNNFVKNKSIKNMMNNNTEDDSEGRKTNYGRR